jgi:probable addiction module antidote protein
MNKKQVLKHTVRYEDGLVEALQDPEEARAYLEVALDEYEENGETDSLLLALRDVAQAQGGVGVLAERSGLNREHLYRVLSSKSNPKLDNLLAIISALGFRLRLDVQQAAV